MSEPARKLFQFEDGNSIWFAIDKCVTSQDMLKGLISKNGGSITDAVINADFYLVSSWKHETQKTAEGVTAEGNVALDSPWVFESIMARRLLPWYPYQVQSLSPYQELSDEGRDLREMAICLGRYRPIVSEDSDIYRFLHMKFPHRTSLEFARLHRANEDQVNACALRLHSQFTRTFPLEEYFGGTSASSRVAYGPAGEKGSHTRNQSQTSVDMQSSIQSPVDLPSLTYSVQTVDTPSQASPRNFGRDSGNHDQTTERRISVTKTWDSAGNYADRLNHGQGGAGNLSSPTSMTTPQSSNRFHGHGREAPSEMEQPSQIAPKRGRPTSKKMKETTEVGSRKLNSGNVPPSPLTNDLPLQRKRMFTEFEVDTMIQWIMDHPPSETDDKRKYWANFAKNSSIGPKRLPGVWQRYYTLYLLPQLSQQKEMLDSVDAMPYHRRLSSNSEVGMDIQNTDQDRSRIAQKPPIASDADEDSDADENDEALHRVPARANPPNRFTETEVEEMLKWIQDHPISVDEDLRKYWEEFAEKSPIGSARKHWIWRGKYTRHIKPRMVRETGLAEQSQPPTGTTVVTHSEDADGDFNGSNDGGMAVAVTPTDQQRRISDPPSRHQTTTPFSGSADRSTQTMVADEAQTSSNNTSRSSVESTASTGEALAALSSLTAITDPASMRLDLQKISPIEWGDYFDRVHEAFALKCYEVSGLALDDISVWKHFTKIHPVVRQDPQFWLGRYKSQKKHLESIIASNSNVVAVLQDNQDNQDHLPSTIPAPVSHGPQSTLDTSAMYPNIPISTTPNIEMTVSTGAPHDSRASSIVQDQSLRTKETGHDNRPAVLETTQTSISPNRPDTNGPSIIFGPEAQVKHESTESDEIDYASMDIDD
ncbi:hypothetical protein FRC14_002593 [Serendipita sp. 396]|nr:hypothetical protein FRC14_002593 [Serendipita sp. 396]KAG8788468.1 hypothetical protein FRC15_004132 [Serendipita sp. 397]